MGKWTEAQKRYAKSSKGLIARRKYQSSEKGKTSRKAYLARRKAKLVEAKQIKEINPVKAKSETGKIEKGAANKK